jgi:hypothetical protein
MNRSRLVSATLICIGLASGCGATTQAGDVKGTPQVWQQVALEPPLTIGFTGWCLVTAASDYGCLTPRVQSGPIVTTTWSSVTGRREMLLLILTTARVMEVESAGVRLPTKATATIPDRLRIAVIRVARPKQPYYLPPVVAFDAQGDRLATPRGHTSEVLLKSVDVRQKGWKGSSVAVAGSCSVEPAAGVMALYGAMATRLPSTKLQVSGGFLTCADGEYIYKGHYLRAAVLVDTEHPGRTPSALPGMASRGGGLLEAPGVSGPMFARRVPRGWLVASNTSDASLARGFLASLRAAVSMGSVPSKHSVGGRG